MDVKSISSLSSLAPATTYVAEPSAATAERSAATPEADELRRRILERILESSQPVPPPPKWRDFGNSRFVRRLASEPKDLLSQLVQQFTADQLLAARVVVRTQSGQLELAKLLATDQAFLVRGEVTGRAVGDIVNQRGKLSSGTSEWRELAGQSMDGNSAHKIPVVLCATDAELYVLVRLGISCTPIAGVDRLTGKQVRALFKKRPQHPQQRRYQMLLLGWQPDLFRNEPSARNLAAIRHVAAIQRTYGCDPHTVFSVWLPNGAELTRIRRAHPFVDREIIAREFKLSLQKSVYAPADALELIADRQPATWSKARAVVLSAVERSTRVAHVSETNIALKKLERAFRQEVLSPLESAAVNRGLPRLKSMAAAELAALWYEEQELVRAARRVVAGQFPGYAKRVDDAALNRKLQLVNGLVKLARN